MESEVMISIHAKNKNNCKLHGFTIIELMVVVIVIGILATIIVVSFGGLQAKSRDTGVLSDVDAMDALQTNYGLKNGVAGKAYYSSNGADSALGFTPSSGDVIDVVVNATDYCIRGYNLSGTKNSIYNAIQKETSSGVCSLLPPSAAAIADYNGTTAVLQTIAGTGGTVSVGGTFVTGAIQTITATANIGYLFSSWTGSTGCSGSASHTITMDSSKACTANFLRDANWISGIAATALSGKFVRSADLGTTKQYKTANTAVASPQGFIGLDTSYLSNMSLVSPQTYPFVDFSAYPAQDACKAIGGRLPTMAELFAIYNGKVTYGNNFPGVAYWSATEVGTNGAYGVILNDGGPNGDSKNVFSSVRCVAG
jgi:prepilin-type N-terminal cleavage/methylation domain-containing protein